MKSRTIDIWEQTVQNPPKAYQQYFMAEKDFLKNNITKSFTILDIGSGSGRTIREIAPLVSRFIGIDNDSEAIALSKAVLNGIENIELYHEDAEHTHFTDQYFDVVFIGLTFCNFGDSKYKILAEIKRILKDDGKFIFSVFNEHALPFREETYKHYEGGYSVVNSEKGLVRFNKNNAISEQFSKSDINHILQKAGFLINNSVSGEMFHMFCCSK